MRNHGIHLPMTTILGDVEIRSLEKGEVEGLENLSVYLSVYTSVSCFFHPTFSDQQVSLAERMHQK